MLFIGKPLFVQKHFPSLIFAPRGAKARAVNHREKWISYFLSLQLGSAGRRRSRSSRGWVGVRRSPNRVSRQRGRHGDGDSRRYYPLLELSEENSDRRALFEVPEGKVGWSASILFSQRSWRERLKTNKTISPFFSFLPFLFIKSRAGRNSITYIHLPVGSKWLYVGTEKGNIHIVHTDSFTLSGYIIHWNKAVEL